MPLLTGRRRVHEQNSITEGVIWKTLLSFFFPILLGSFFQQMYNTIDAIVVGKFIGKEALAAVGGTTGVLINLIVGFFVGLSSGATVILSQFYGGRQKEEVSHAVHTAAAMALCGGLIIMAVGLTCSPFMLRLLGTPEEVMEHALTYMRIFFLGMIPSLIYNIGSGLLRAVGDSRRPLFFLICACMINIVLDVLFVVGFEMGVAGAALATILSQTVSAVLVVLTLTRTSDMYKLQVRKIRFHGNLLGGIVRIGFPAGMQSVLYAVSNMSVQSGVNSFGTDVVAAYTALGKLDGLFWMVIGAFGISITTFVGQNFGAKHYDRVRRAVRVCLGMAFIATVALSLFFLFFGEGLYHLFTDDAVVVAHGMDMLRFLIPCYVLYICIEVLSGALRGTGDAVVPTLFTLFGVCVLRVVWVMFAVPFNPTVRMVIFCYPLTWTITSAMCIAYYLKSNWLERSIRRAGHVQEA